MCNNFRVRGDGAASIFIWRRSVIEWLATSAVAKFCEGEKRAAAICPYFIISVLSILAVNRVQFVIEIFVH